MAQTRAETVTAAVMSRLSRFSIFALAILGVLFVSRGAMLWGQAEFGVVIRNYIAENSIVPGKAYMWTWGVGPISFSKPDLWHFQVIFVANKTADILLLWNLNESVLFQRTGSRFEETFDVSMPPTDGIWRWDWLIRNPDPTVLNVYNFTVTHYPISFPERLNGTIAIGTGIAMIIFAIIVLAYVRRRDIAQR